jgi:hypothetical protein
VETLPLAASVIVTPTNHLPAVAFPLVGSNEKMPVEVRVIPVGEFDAINVAWSSVPPTVNAYE